MDDRMFASVHPRLVLEAIATSLVPMRRQRQKFLNRSGANSV